MENYLKPYDKEYMRMAILKHEETFKEQVYELHRLYRIQKIMMRNIASNRTNGRSQELGSSNNGFSFNQSNQARGLNQRSLVKLDLERPGGEENVAESNADRELIDENEIELTLGPTKYNQRKKAETPLTSDSGPSFSSSSTGSSQINRTSSLNHHHHQKTSKRREELTGHNFGLVQVSDMTLGYQNASKNSIVVDEQFRQERLKQPPWLFQVLSLNTT
ncbi:hypothetical protein Tsubulata_001542 [Turnera subulata]|uniref:Uncharacterized protein n=1 Tax=Turnera subulata TaxID=218843 RepID=A0A9Q0F8B8_9ROSI|nr:hypothetical protein Tsubulata_001542 [Turnera subulata]